MGFGFGTTETFTFSETPKVGDCILICYKYDDGIDYHTGVYKDSKWRFGYNDVDISAEVSNGKVKCTWSTAIIGYNVEKATYIKCPV